MSDTTTPSAAEVMGWGHAPNDSWGPWHRPGCDRGGYFDPCDCWHGGPTPDDMLDWLRENDRVDGVYIGHHPYRTKSITDAPVELRMLLDFAFIKERWVEVEAPTLHAALEQAVIAVGRAEPECRCYTVHEPHNAACPRNA